MAASSRKKQEKKKDFQKAKLKVGKTKPKPDNFTNTSFKAKSIVLNKQSISVTAPSAASQFSHHVSLLRHRSDSQRQESLAYLTTAISAQPSSQPLPEPAAVLLPKLQPLVLDGSLAVRQQLLKLLRCLAPSDVQPQAEQILTYVHAGMTHLSADIRMYSMDVLDWLLDIAGEAVVSCAGGWYKTLRCFSGMLGWQQEQNHDQNGWSQFQTSNARPGSSGRGYVKQLNTLATLINVGIGRILSVDHDAINASAMTCFPLYHTRQHLLPQRPNTYEYLDLFGAQRNEEDDMIEDREARQTVFVRRFQRSFDDGIELIKKEGGELGRGAALVRKAMKQGMADYTYDDDDAAQHRPV